MGTNKHGLYCDLCKKHNPVSKVDGNDICENCYVKLYPSEDSYSHNKRFMGDNSMKKYKEDMMGFVGTGVTLGVGNAVLGSLPGGAGTSSINAMNKGAGMMGAMGVAMGGTAVLRQLGNMTPSPKKKKKNALQI